MFVQGDFVILYYGKSKVGKNYGIYGKSPLNHHLEDFPTTLSKLKPVVSGWDNSMYRGEKNIFPWIFGHFQGPHNSIENDRIGAHFVRELRYLDLEGSIYPSYPSR